MAQKDQRTTNALLRERYGDRVTFKQLQQFLENEGYYPFYIRKDPQYRLERGVYRVPGPDEPLSAYGPNPDAPASVEPDTKQLQGEMLLTERTETQQSRLRTNTPGVAFKHDSSMSAADITARLKELEETASALAIVPERLKEFVPFGEFETVRAIIASREFMPVFTTGLSGNGKTLFPEQACALEGREYIHIDITAETDEDDLLGGFRLRNGDTYFELGPVVIAMLRGCVLSMNELDLASPKIMCLQRVLEGKPLTLKKLGIIITPKPGFNVFATANTKGRGDENGRYIGTGLLNEAFLERFPITIEQPYPDVETEQKILLKTFIAAGGTPTATDRKFFEILAKWADGIRETYEKEGIEDLIATRRLCHIVRVYKIFGDQEKAILLCINRFDGKVKTAFVDLFNKLVQTNSPSNVGKKPGAKSAADPTF